MKKLFVFDLDGTLAPSKSSISPEIASLLHDLLKIMKVAVISGGSWTQFEEQLLARLPSDDSFENLYLLPTCGTKMYSYSGQWSKVYAEDLTDEQRAQIISALEIALRESGVTVPRVWGEAIEDRGSQVTLSVLGQDAPLSEKEKWDPDFSKRTRIKEIVTPLLPTLSVNMGGTTSIDVTKPGIDKAYGIRKLTEQLGVTIKEMIFAGDALFVGGNDFPVQEAGVDSILVRDPSETARVIQTVLACLGDNEHQILSPGRLS